VSGAPDLRPRRPSPGEIVTAIVLSNVSQCEAAPGSAEDFAARERISALLYQLGMSDVRPELEMEADLADQGLLLRRAPRTAEDDDQEDDHADAA
jgi:hypothetical protein